MTYIWRNIAVTDIQQLALLEQQNHPNGWSESFLHSYIGKAKSTDLAIQDYFWVIEDKQKSLIAAYVMLNQIDHFAEIINFGVNQDYRGLGLAKYLLLQIYQLLLKSACANLELEVRASNKPAQQLYLSLQMTQIGVKYDYYNYLLKDQFMTEDAFIYQIKPSAMERVLDQQINLLQSLTPKIIKLL